MMSLDNDSLKYDELVNAVYRENAEITLPAEYASFITNNTLRLLIRLARYKFVFKMLKSDDCVLEIGCGSGVGSIFMAQKCSKVVGIDMSNREIEEAKRINRRENVEFFCGDFFKLSQAKKFDVIVALDVIEHLHVEEGKNLIQKSMEYLKPDGMLIIGTPSIFSYEYQSPLSKAAHVKLYNQDELVDLINNFFGRCIAFSMNDEVVHTGFSQMAWYYFILGFYPKGGK